MLALPASSQGALFVPWDPQGLPTTPSSQVSLLCYLERTSWVLTPGACRP